MALLHDRTMVSHIPLTLTKALKMAKTDVIVAQTLRSMRSEGSNNLKKKTFDSF